MNSMRDQEELAQKESTFDWINWGSLHLAERWCNPCQSKQTQDRTKKSHISQKGTIYQEDQPGKLKSCGWMDAGTDAHTNEHRIRLRKTGLARKVPIFDWINRANLNLVNGCGD
jgi:hypothetical protein